MFFNYNLKFFPLKNQKKKKKMFVVKDPGQVHPKMAHRKSFFFLNKFFDI